MESEPAKIEEAKPKRQKKKKGKITQAYQMHQKGMSAKEIAEKMGLSTRVVRSYIWRAANPDKYKALLQRYWTKKKQKREIEEVKQVVENEKKESQ